MASPPLRYTKTSPQTHRNPSPFTRLDQVRNSTLAARHRNLVVAMMRKNRFGDELWLSTESIQVILGRLYHRRTDAPTDTIGRKLGSCAQASRRTVQRQIDQLANCRTCNRPASDHRDTAGKWVANHEFVPRVEGGGVLDQIYPANSRVPYNGHIEFRRSATYCLVPEKLTPRRTWEEYRDSKPYVTRKPPQPATPRSTPAPLPPAPTPIRPPAKFREPNDRTWQKFMATFYCHCKGVTYSQPPEGGIGCTLSPGDRGYVKPFPPLAALLAACKSFGIEVAYAKARLEAAGHKIPSLDGKAALQTEAASLQEAELIDRNPEDRTLNVGSRISRAQQRKLENLAINARVKQRFRDRFGSS